jgi:hypothetical protein
MQPKARMTFRFDPPQPPSRPQSAGSLAGRLPERPAEAVDGRPMAGTIPPRDEPAQDQTLYHTEGPLRDDLYLLEEMIRRADPIRVPVTVAATTVTDLPNWSPEEDVQHRAGWISGALTRSEGPSWWRVFASVAGAVATGALFGYLVLTLFTGESPFPIPPASGTDAHAQASAEPGVVSSQVQGTIPSGNSGAGSAGQITASSMYLLQYGVFRSQETMNAALDVLKGKGLPSAVDRADGYRIYVGATDSSAEALRLVGQLAGLEVYVKSSVGDAIRASAAQGGEELAAFVQQSAELTRKLSGLSVSALQDELPQPMDPSALSSLRETYRLWLEAVPGAARLTGTAQEAAKSIEQSLKAAMVSVDDYSRKNSRFHLWSIQSDVMNAILGDRGLRSTLQNDNKK